MSDPTGTHMGMGAGDRLAPAAARRPPMSGQARHEAVETLLRHAIRMVEQARPMPLSTSVMISRDEVLAVLRQALGMLPEEMRAARWLLKERDDMRSRMQREGDEIIAAARSRAEQMVQRSEVVKAADLRARQTVRAAEDKALRMKLETEDWCDQRLATFEAGLQKTLNMVLASRQKLQGTRISQPTAQIEAVAPPTPAALEIYDREHQQRPSDG